MRFQTAVFLICLSLGPLASAKTAKDYSSDGKAVYDQDPSAAPASPSTGSSSLTSSENGLPRKGSIAWNLGLAVSGYGFSDLESAYGSALSSHQAPFGAEVDLGVDYTLFSGFQAGLQFQGMTRFPERVAFSEAGSGVETDEWTANVVGGALVVKALVPLGAKHNLVFYGEGGYYTLVGSQISMSDTNGNKGTVTLDGSNVGGEAGLEVEFLQGDNNSWAVDLGLGYRYLQISPITSIRTVNGIAGSAHTLANADGTHALVDLSGLRLNGTIRFF